jgi:autotransporter-associated beta strand protein
MATGLAGATVTNLTFNGNSSGSIGIVSGLQGFFCGPNGNCGITINIPVTGSGGIQQSSGGYLALYATNTYTGGTTLTGGQLVYYNNNNSFGTGTITVNGSGNALVGSASPISIPNSIVIQASSTNYNFNLASSNPTGSTPGTTFTGSFTLPTAGAFTLNDSSATTALTQINGPITGGSAIIYADNGTLQLAGTNTYTGNSAISSPNTVIVVGSGSLGGGAYSGTITNNSILVFNTSANQTLSGIMSGTGRLTQEGSGTLTLSAAETYSGGTSNSGTLVIGGGGTITAAGKITNNGTFKYSSSATENISGVISGTGTLQVTSGTLTLSGANTYSGITTITGGTLNIGSDTNTGTAPLGASPGSFVANQITLSGGTLGLTATAADITANRGITLTAPSTISATSGQTPTVDSVITGGFALTKSAAGNLNLNAANTFTGGLTITGGGVRFNNASAAGTGTITVTPASIVTLRQLSPPGPTSVTVTNTVILNTNSGNDIDLACALNNTFTLSGNISGVGYLTRDRGTSGNGTVVLSGSNSFSGGLLWRGSVIGVGSSNALGTGTVLMSPANTDPLTLTATTPLTGANALTNIVQIAVSNATQQITISGTNDVELAGSVVLGQTGSLSPVITNNNTGATIISGVISSGLAGTGFTNAGSGVMVISGSANTYAGPTVVNGKLKVTGNITTSSGVTVNSGGTLSGPGTVPTLAINSGGTVSPGSSPGSMATLDETWAGGGNYNWEINAASGTAGADPGWDRLNITGGLNITASSGTPFVIKITSLTTNDVAGSVFDFDNTTNYSWSIATTSGGITNFSASAFTLNTAAFANSLGGGAFIITTNATDVLLLFGQKPVISSLTPANPTNTVGDNITFTASASSADPFTYQWQKGGTNISNATNSTYAIMGAHVTDAATYSIVVANQYGSVTNSAVLTVNQANLMVSATAQSKTYGQTVVTGAGNTNFSSVGLKNGEVISTVTLSISGSGDASNAPVSGSPYTITPSLAVGTFTPADYILTYNSGLLTVNPATLTVTADNFTRIFGVTNPVFTVTYTNFVNGETLGTSDVGGTPALTTAADTNSDVGSYVITNGTGTLTSTNYTFNLYVQSG